MASNNPFDESNRPLPVPIDDGFDFDSYNLVTTPTEQVHVEHEERYLKSPSIGRSSTARSSMLTPTEQFHVEHEERYLQSPSHARSSTARSSMLTPVPRSPMVSSRATSRMSSPMASPNTSRKQQRHISFATDLPSPVMLQSKRFADELEEVKFDVEDESSKSIDTKTTISSIGTKDIASDTPSRAQTVMKRHRWGTQRHKKGRPKRTMSVFRKNSSHVAKETQHDHSEGNEDPPGRKVFFSVPLPNDMVSPENGLPLTHYPRNKIRTTKYTPLSFVPKNLYYQFQNVANIFFFLIAVLGVSTTMLQRTV
jgi:hypothetical protein